MHSVRFELGAYTFYAETDYKAKRCKRVFCTEIRNGKIEYIIRYNGKLGKEQQMDVINGTSSEWIEKQHQLVSEMEFDLIKRSVKVLEGNTTDDTNMPWSPYRCILPGKGTFDGIWNWDSAFHAMAVSRWDIQLAKECILGFLRFQDDNGLFPDVIFSDGRMINDYSKPPVFPWAAEIVYRRSNDVEFLKEIYPRFVKNESFLCENRCYNGLFFYDAQDKDSPEYNTNARYESGLDNSVRWDEPIAQLWAVDLNCYMVMMYRSMKYFAQELYLEADIQKWSERETALTKLIEEKLWDDDNKYYCDANRFTGKRSAVLTPASFMPLFIGTASEERAKYMNGYASDSNKFYSGMPTVTYDNPAYSTDYWRGPTWLNVAYFAAKGLKNYGFKTADTIKKTILTWCDSDKRGIFENYNSTTGEGMCCDHFSWSAAFIIEFILNF